MLQYNLNTKDKKLFVNLPDTFCFNLDFLDNMTELMSKATETTCDEVLVSSPISVNYDNLTKAYLLNLLRCLSHSKSTKWNKGLSDAILPNIHKCDGNRFTDVDMIEVLLENKTFNYYIFKENQKVSKPVNEMAKILVEKNVIIEPEQVKEFLSTTIGEIFSNCFLHSNRDEAFFMFDIVLEDNDFYLYVNISDFGTTIINNVKNYFKEKNTDISSVDCFKWATQKGTTTRLGSGGYGLATLIEYIEAANGELYIFSGDAYYSLKNKTSTISYSLGTFGGTSVSFKVKLFESSQFLKFDAHYNKIVSISLDSI